MKIFEYFILVIIEILLFSMSYKESLESISGWLIGINFTFAIFSINFTFFGYQLSRYKTILDKPAFRQWVNIILLLTFPFIPLLAYFIAPYYYAHVALWLLPIIVFSSIDNARLTIYYLDPAAYLSRLFTKKSLNQYIDSLYALVSTDVRKHKAYLDNKEKFQIPAHEWSFLPDQLGINKHDLWDKVTVVIKQAFDNNDYPVFAKAINQVMILLLSSYNLQSKHDGDYNELAGIQLIAHKRMRGIINWISIQDKEGTYIEALTNMLCANIKLPQIIQNPLSDLAESIMSDLSYIGSITLKLNIHDEPIKVLTTIHAAIEFAVHQIEEDAQKGRENTVEQYNVAHYAYLIKSLGLDALISRHEEFVYRCMETLSYLGCNAANIKSRQTVGAVFECLVQLGRASRKAGLVCFWNRCIIPLHDHAEEFMGHILTWLIKDIKKDGSFTLKGCAEQAYSRLRGVRCTIIPKANCHPKFWIEENIDPKTGKPISHIETMEGMYGYIGMVDYSDFKNLTEYNLLVADGSGYNKIQILSQ